MTGWSSAFLLTAVLLLIGTPGAAAAADEAGRPLFAFTDRAIAESSGLVDTGAVVYTVNDSGSGPVLYAVDPRSGDTTRRTTYTPDEVEDVEALAPGRAGTVWVADVGDNQRSRDSVSLYRARHGATTTAPRLDLAYPDGPRDAETLLAHPRTGRLFVVSKTVFGGTVYAVPAGARPGGTLTMRRFAQVPGLITDGAFLPDGRHVVLRSYATATVFTFPAFEVRGTFDLPEQRQGEAVSVSPRGRVLLSSEGVGAEVLQVEIPARLTRDVRPGSAPSASAAPVTPDPAADDPRPRDRPDRHPLALGLRLAAGLVFLGALGLGLRRLWRADRP
ncbi:MAG TPA: hypothetical protein VFH10_04540 [Nocardioides sp.]|uniref:hypothetical protein n=1 Tax=Nocardioides sp. TaxID=35761 RepID=UPI002D7FE8D6|nr:hypothetical protein [Nocardioides sp.]HET6651889.1 hypothetical protein [Nocardioides sp.]